MTKAKDKVLRVFKFLKALNELRNPATVDLRDQPWSLPLKLIPIHESVKVGPRDGEGSDVVLSIRRPALTPAPVHPPALSGWLLPSWNDAARALQWHESRNERGPDGNTLVVEFKDDAERLSALEDWRPSREAWAKNEQPAIAAGKLFSDLYELYARLEREAERIELIIGDGILSWSQADVHVFHPILLQKLQLQFEPSVPKFTIIDSGGVPDLYTAPLLGMECVDGKALARCRSELALNAFHPLGGEETSGFLRALAHSLSAAAIFDGDALPPRKTDVPRIGRDPVLFVRARNLGFGKALEDILADLLEREDLPTSLLRIVGEETDIGAAPTTEIPAETWSEPEHVLLSKEANPEQIQIASRLDAHGCVLVQGPPGTGKTHTIANLIGHLLAQEKSVLVTSHTTKALRVLRDKVVPSLRPLCVSVLESDLESRGQLEGAVTAIAERLSGRNTAQLDAQAQQFAAQRKQLLDALRTARNELVQAQADEYRDVVVGGRSWRPSDAARLVLADEPNHSWIPGPVELGGPCPLSPGETLELYATNVSVSGDQEQELNLPLPTAQEVLSPQAVSALFRRLGELDTAETQYRDDLWQEDIGQGHEAELREVAAHCLKATQTLDASQPWKLSAVAAGRAGDIETWESLIAIIEAVRRHASSSAELILRHGPELDPEGADEGNLECAAEIRLHLEKGGGLGTLLLLTRPTWRRFLKRARVAGSSPRQPEHFIAIEALLRLAVLRSELRGRWDRQLGSLGAPKADQFGGEPEQACLQFVGEIRNCLNWTAKTWAPLEQQLQHRGLRWQQLFDEEAPNLLPNGQLLRLKSAAAGSLQRVLEARALALEHLRLIRQARDLVGLFETWGGTRSASAVVRELATAVEMRNSNAYAAAFARLVDLLARRSALQRRQELLGKLDPIAPGWAAAVRSRKVVHCPQVPPGDVEHGWVWRQLNDELERRNRVQFSDLQQTIDTTSSALRRTTADLIERRAWAGQQRRTTLAQQQALVGWLDTIRKIGKGGGKRAPQLKVQAARQMNLCRSAVPVWVMPLAQVVENFDAQTRFDVVIIDEASQSDVLALTAMYLGKRVVIVGDHEQVSPSAVGQKLELVQQLITEHLSDIPNGHLYDGQTSVYDLARQSFGGMVCLTEHFRCVPEIIEFSNQLSYGGRIKPLRDASSTALKPALVLHHVEGYSDDKVNVAEANAVTSLIMSACERMEYANKTIGVISLVGDEQAFEIERMLRERMSPSELEHRKLLCGNAAQFQGDERDVMFLSMVDASKGSPLALRAIQGFKQRYNVAVSRARDQLWLIHSLNPETDLKPEDLRRQLITHCADPFGMRNTLQKVEAAAESPFEYAVLERLIRAGYSVTPQWEVGHYRIDIVVEGGGKKAAVECDGDRYHPIEKLPEDMGRQATLERVGWRFVRIRGTAFFRNPEASMDKVFAKLTQLGVTPDGQMVTPPVLPTHQSLQEEVIRRSAGIVRSWGSRDANIRS